MLHFLLCSFCVGCVDKNFNFDHNIKAHEDRPRLKFLSTHDDNGDDSKARAMTIVLWTFVTAN